MCEIHKSSNVIMLLVQVYSCSKLHVDRTGIVVYNYSHSVFSRSSFEVFSSFDGVYVSWPLLSSTPRVHIMTSTISK